MKFKSQYTDRMLTPAQYLAETMCVRKASHFNEKLPDKFWDLPDWKNYFKFQLISAYPLLKKYEFEVISNAIKSLPYIYSLKSPKLDAALKTHKKKFDTEAQIPIKVIEITDEPQILGKTFVDQKSQLSKLKDL